MHFYNGYFAYFYAKKISREEKTDPSTSTTKKAGQKNCPNKKNDKINNGTGERVQTSIVS